MLKCIKNLFSWKIKPIKKIKDSFSWSNPNLELKETGKCGIGVFAKKGIKKGELLAIFGGYVMHNNEMLALPKEINDNCINVTEDLVLGIRHQSELEMACFFNHSCNPNSGSRGQIFLEAMRNIKKGEEVTFDYAMTLCESTESNPYKMECFCGSKKCRKIITDSDWRMEDLQEKYKGYFQLYVEDRINKLNNK